MEYVSVETNWIFKQLLSIQFIDFFSVFLLFDLICFGLNMKAKPAPVVFCEFALLPCHVVFITNQHTCSVFCDYIIHYCIYLGVVCPLSSPHFIIVTFTLVPIGANKVYLSQELVFAGDVTNCNSCGDKICARLKYVHLKGQ